MKKALVAFGLLLAAVYAILPPASRTTAFREVVQGALDRATPYEIRFADFRLTYALGVEIGALRIAAPGSAPFLRATSVKTGLHPRALASGRLGKVLVAEPVLFVDRLPQAGGQGAGGTDGEGGTGSGGAPGGSKATIPFDGVEIRNGWVRYGDDESRPAIGPFSLDVDSIRADEALELRGKATIGGDGAIDWSARVGSGAAGLDGRVSYRFDSLSGLATTMPKALIPLALHASSGNLALTVRGDLRQSIDVGLRGEILLPGLPSSWPLSGDGTFDAAERKGSLLVRVEVDPAAPLTLAATIEGTHLAGRVEWPAVDLGALAALSRLADLEASGTLDLEARVEGAIDALQGDGHLRVSKAAVSGATWGVAGDLDLPFAVGPGAVEFSNPGIRVRNASGIVGGWEWKMEGASARGSIGYGSGKAPRARVRLATRGFEFHDPEFLHAGEAIVLQAAVDASLIAGDEQDLTIEGSVSEGGVLWKRLYLDLAKIPVTVDGKARRRADRIEIDSLQASVEGIGRVETEGRYRWQREDYTIAARIDLPGLSRLYDVAVRETFEQAYPFLARTDVDGHVSADLRYDRSAAGESSLRGRLGVTGGKFSSADPSMEVRELEVDLPIDLGQGPHEGKTQPGALRADSLRFGDIEISGAEAALLVERNRVALQRPVVLELLGGQLTIGDFDARDLARATRHAECAVGADGLDLAGLTRALGWPELPGSVTGSIPKIRVDRERLSTEGEIDAQLLRGTARIRQLRIEQLFSPVPALGLDLSFENISLGQLTGALEIGRVTGVLQGDVRDLVLVNRQPLGFEADVTTVPVKGVSQRISVAAIRQLSILGGAGGDPITQGILSLFDEYRYSKMGFRCRLHNDRFVLRGVEKFDGKDYLVVGATFPPRVHVISHNQTVDFSQMMRRIESAFASRGEPNAAR